MAIDSARTTLLGLLIMCSSTVHAVRISVEEYATLCQAERTTMRPRVCVASAGTTVRILGTPVKIGEAEPNRLRLVRVIEGPCSGFELTLPYEFLADLRPQPVPTAARKLATCLTPSLIRRERLQRSESVGSASTTTALISQR